MLSDSDLQTVFLDAIAGKSRQEQLDILQSKLLAIVPPAQRASVELALTMLLELKGRRPSLVVLVHGIQTNAEWHDTAETVLRNSTSLTVLPIKYGPLGVLKLLCPIFTRKGPIKYVLRELRAAQVKYPASEISVVAHSFGTYAIAEILKNETDIRIHRLLLCGAIVSKGYRWDRLAAFPTGGVLNFCGTKDIWPIIAKVASWGYGMTGRYGLGIVNAKDLYFDVGHSGFFDEEFVAKYWMPYLERGEIVEPRTKRKPTSIGLMIFSWFHVAWLVVFVALFIVYREIR